MTHAKGLIPPPDEQRPTHVRYLVLAMLCALGFITYLDRICISQVQGSIAEDLQFGQLTAEDENRLDAGIADNYQSLLRDEDMAKLEKASKLDDEAARRQTARERLADTRMNHRLSWVFAAFLVGYTLFEIPGGWLGDVWGPRSVLLRIVVWWSLFTALTGSVDTVLRYFLSSPAPWVLVLGIVVVRFMFGLGEAGAYPTVGRALARWFPYRERAMAQGFIWTASRLGGAFAPPIIILLTEGLGNWRFAFWLLGILGVIWAIAYFLWFRDRPEQKASVNAAEAALIRAEAAGVGSVYDDKSHQTVPWGLLVRSVNLWATYLTAAAVSFSWYFNVTFLPKYIKDQYHVDYKDSWKITMWPLLVSACFCCLGGVGSDYLIRRTGSRRWGRSLPGLVGFTVAGFFVLVAQAMPSAESFIALVCIACALQDLAIPCIWAVCADIGGRYAGTVSGCMNTVGGVGGTLGILVIPFIAERYGMSMVLVVNAVVYVFGGLLWLRIDATETILRRKETNNDELRITNDPKMSNNE